MNRKTRVTIVVGIAVVTAALASLGMYVVVASGSRRVEAPRVFVVVARKNLQMGAAVAEADIKLVAWPKENLIPGAFTSIDQVRDHALVADVLENEPITESKLAKAGVGLTPIIDKGYRAMSVKVNEVIGVAGFVTPGTHVDVLVTIRRNQDAKSRVVVQDVKVLTAGAKYDDPEGRREGKPIPSTVVTLMVTPQQAERIAVAATQGQIMLALRNPLDKGSVATLGVTAAELMVGPVPPAPGPTPPRVRHPAPSSPPRVEPAPPCHFETFKAGKREVLPCT